MLKLDFIYSKSYNFVYLRAKSILKKEEDILQLMKEVYLHAFAHANEFNEDNLYEWLGKQTYILGCSKYRRKKVREADIVELERRDYEAQKNLDREITKEVIRDALEELPDMYQATLYAFYYDHMKFKEIASVMGYSKKAMINRLNYTHKYLGKVLENFAEEKEDKVDVQFSVEIVVEALREWSALNRMSADAAQSMYVSVCRELGEQTEDIEFKENELAGANSRIAGNDINGMEAICGELEAYSKVPAIGKKQIAIIVAAVLAVGAILLAAFLLQDKFKKTDEPKEDQQITQQQEVQEPADSQTQTDADVTADSETDADVETEDEPVADDNEETQEPTTEEPEYILPNSNTVKLTRNDLSGLSKEQLRLARNEIFARHGMIFGAEDLKNYFSSKSWYQPSVPYAEFYDKVEMNLIEEANVDLILKVEEQME